MTVYGELLIRPETGDGCDRQYWMSRSSRMGRGSRVCVRSTLFNVGPDKAYILDLLDVSFSEIAVR
jgi:hypothetical protein